MKTRREFLKETTSGILTAAAAQSFILGCREGIEKRYSRLIDNRKFSLYFGDLHGHTRLSPDAMLFIHDLDPEEHYRYGRDVAGLDFAAITDHDAPFGLKYDVSKWERILELAKKYHEPNRFVTFNAYEWTSGDGVITLSEYLKGNKWTNYEKDLIENKLWGHRNVYFPGDDVPEHVFAVDDEASNTPEKLWLLLKPYGAIAIPHHPLGGPVPPFKWDHYGGEVEPVVEIYSFHGNSEADDAPLLIYNPYDNGLHNVQYALGVKKYKFGIIASTDTHMGRAGYKGDDLSVEFMRPKFGGQPAAGGGLAAIYAEELTREKLWESLLKRRTFGTTGEKMVVDFSIGKAFMGEEFSADSPQTIRAKAIGTVRLKNMEIIKNGSILYSRPCTERSESFEYIDEPITPGFCYYYLRVTQQDNEMAWSSPIWVNYI